MTETGAALPSKPNNRRRRRCFIISGVIFLLLILLLIIILILALTVFKAKQPKVDVPSASLDGFSPRVSFPVINIQLNLSLNLDLLVHNKNYASFKHGDGKSYLFYKDKQVGEADLSPGYIPSRGTGELSCRLTVQVDKLASDAGDLLQNIISGQVAMESRTRIPGRVTFLGMIKKHIVAASDCSFTFGFPAMKILSQECKTMTKF